MSDPAQPAESPFDEIVNAVQRHFEGTEPHDNRPQVWSVHPLEGGCAVEVTDAMLAKKVSDHFGSEYLVTHRKHHRGWWRTVLVQPKH